MQFASLFVFATAITAVPSLVRRDTAETLASLQSIDKSTNTLTLTVNGWDGTVLGALGIQSASTAVGTQIENANSKASDEAQSTSPDSQNIIGYVTSTLTPDIQAALNALNSKKEGLRTQNLTQIVLRTLKSLQTKSATFGTTLVNMASADQKSAAQAAADTINGYFTDAVTAFSS